MSVTSRTSWAKQTSGTAQPLFDVSCFTAMRCKAVGSAGTILYTRDGGSTWRGQSNPLVGSATSLSRIECVAPRSCYAIGPPSTVLVTHDGGATWTSHTLPVVVSSSIITNCINASTYPMRGRVNLCRSGLTDVSCTSATTCYLTANPNAVFRTTDGGASWQS